MKFWNWLVELYHDVRYGQEEADFTGLNPWQWGDQ